MDDLQFRRIILADPNNQDPEFIEAKNADATRQKLSQDVDALDNKIAQALSVDVPDELCNKLILRQTMDSHRLQKRKSRIHLALAASVAFAFGLTLNFMQASSAYSGLDGYALAHVYHEQDAFNNNSDARVSLASLNTKMAAFNGSFLGNVGELISADYCRFDSVKSLHLVYQGEHSPVNVFIVPNRDDVKFSSQFSDSLYRGKASTFGAQNVIVVGDKTEPLEKWQQNLSKNITWSI